MIIVNPDELEMPVRVKDPAAKLDYVRNWADWLDEDETIAASTWDVAEGDVTLSAESNTTATTKVWVEGGTLGSDAVITNQVTTSAGRIDERSIRLLIRNR